MARKRSKNNFTIKDNYVLIHTKNVDFIVDLEDFSKIKDFRWFSKKAKSTNKFYAYSHFKGNKKILLHRYLLDVDDPIILVDHKDGNTLDNRKNNLRIATRQQNNINSKKRKNSKSEYKGVTLRPSGRWGVYIAKDGTRYCLGTYNTESEAATIYNKKAIDLYGEFAKLNIIKGVYNNE